MYFSLELFQVWSWEPFPAGFCVFLTLKEKKKKKTLEPIFSGTIFQAHLLPPLPSPALGRFPKQPWLPEVENGNFKPELKC